MKEYIIALAFLIVTILVFIGMIRLILKGSMLNYPKGEKPNVK